MQEDHKCFYWVKNQETGIWTCMDSGCEQTVLQRALNWAHNG